MAARIHRRKHAARGAMKARIVFPFKAAETVVVEANVAQHLRGDLIVGVEALEFLLEVDAFEVESSDSVGDLGRDAARDPREAVSFIQAIRDLVFSGLGVFRIGVHNCGEGAGSGFFVVDLGGAGIDGVDMDGHRQLAEVAIIENTAAGSYLKGALLLLLRALYVFRVLHDLKPEEAEGDGAGPKQKECAYKPKARQLHRRGARGGATRAVSAKSCLHGKKLARLSD